MTDGKEDMAETKTVELPLTKTERNHLANVERRDAKRARSQERQAAKNERDEKLKAINAEYAPKIAKLQADAAAARVKVWQDWRKKREASAA